MQAPVKIEELTKDLRKEHFTLGNDKPSLLTTNMDLAATLSLASLPRLEHLHGQAIKAEMRGHHFTYGKDPTHYETMATYHYQQHDLKDAKE